MADNDGKAASAPGSSGTADAIALGACDGRLDPRAAAYLEEQTRLARPG